MSEETQGVCGMEKHRQSKAKKKSYRAKNVNPLVYYSNDGETLKRRKNEDFVLKKSELLLKFPTYKEVIN